MEEPTQTPIQDYATELEAGVFNLVISLVTHRATFVGYSKSRQQVAEYLEKLANVLREEEN